MKRIVRAKEIDPLKKMKNQAAVIQTLKAMMVKICMRSKRGNQIEFSKLLVMN